MRLLLALAALLGGPAFAGEAPPHWLHLGAHSVYDGITDDLVTGGLGAEGMLGTPPGFADPLHPTAAELRRAALYAYADKGQGFGRLYGPNIDETTRAVLPDHGKIAGEEYLAYADDGEARQNVAMLLQIPRDLSLQRRCLVVVAISGTGGLFSDVVDFGYWGLRRHCAVVYTDKGQGNGFDFLEPDTVNLLDGRQVPAAEAGHAAQFRADLDTEARKEFLAEFPHRIAFKAAHSKQNPERDWTEDVLRAARFALYMLRQRSPGFTPAGTLVIATGSSDGGGAVIRAAEADGEHLIDGVVARAPQVQIRTNEPVRVIRGLVSRVGSGRPRLDYMTIAGLYQPCAVVAVRSLPQYDPTSAEVQRCASLHDTGLLRSDGTERQAHEALERMHASGWDPEADILLAYPSPDASEAMVAAYASGYGRFGVRDRLCGYSYAAVDRDGRPVAVSPAERAQIFAIAAGRIPAGTIELINDNDPTGPRQNTLSLSPNTGRRDDNFAGALCVHHMLLSRTLESKRIEAGMAEVLASGKLDGTPAIIVHGRSDARVPAGLSSRPYVAWNSLADGETSSLRYVEVTNAGHFDTYTPEIDTRVVPLAPYHLWALDAMWAHLTTGAPLPPDQVVRTKPRRDRTGAAPPLSAANIPPIAADPAPRDRIVVSGGTIRIPN